MSDLDPRATNSVAEKHTEGERKGDEAKAEETRPDGARDSLWIHTSVDAKYDGAGLLVHMYTL